MQVNSTDTSRADIAVKSQIWISHTVFHALMHKLMLYEVSGSIQQSFWLHKCTSKAHERLQVVG